MGTRGARSGRRSRGFTLSELMASLAVIATLAAIAGPQFGRVRDQARRTLCLSQLRQIAHAHALYVQNWDDQLPAWCFPDANAPASPERARFWTDYLSPYLRHRSPLWDPSVRRHGEPSREQRSDYTLLTRGPGGEGTWLSPYWRGAGPPLAVSHVRRDAETILFSDGSTWNTEAPANPFRHGGGGNVTFVDGHARWMRVTERRERLADASGFTWMRFFTADR